MCDSYQQVEGTTRVCQEFMLPRKVEHFLVTSHTTRIVEKWIACFYQRYTVPSQAVLHTGNYIMMPN